MAKSKTKDDDLIDLPCSFGSVSFGVKTCRVGVNVDREFLKLSDADKNLCDRRLTLTIHANAKGDQAGQGRLEGMSEDIDLTGVADVKSFGVHSQHIGFGLTFNSNEVKKIAAKTGVQFNEFVGREGRVIIAQVDEIPDDDKDEDAGDAAGESEE